MAFLSAMVSWLLHSRRLSSPQHYVPTLSWSPSFGICIVATTSTLNPMFTSLSAWMRCYFRIANIVVDGKHFLILIEINTWLSLLQIISQCLSFYWLKWNSFLLWMLHPNQCNKCNSQRKEASNKIRRWNRNKQQLMISKRIKKVITIVTMQEISSNSNKKQLQARKEVLRKIDE